MKERKDWVKHYNNFTYTKYYKWVKPRKEIRHEFDPRSNFWYEKEVEFPGFWIFAYTLPLQKITCLDNNWEYHHKYHRSRHPQTYQEKSVNELHKKEFYQEDIPVHFRRKRNGYSLPDYYDDLPISNVRVRSWKNTHKCKKQWMKNL